MQRSAIPPLLISVFLVGLALPPAALAASDAATGKAVDASATSVPSEPGQTSATFGDWVLRCERVSQGDSVPRLCEVAQALVVQGQQAPIAQLAFAHPPAPDRKSEDEPLDDTLTVTVLVPTNITFAKPPVLASTTAKDGSPTISLGFRRCLPGGCLADGMPDATFLKALHSTKAGALTFTDAAGHSITLPVSFRGLTQALDQFGKEQRADAAKAVTR